MMRQLANPRPPDRQGTVRDSVTIGAAQRLSRRHRNLPLVLALVCAGLVLVAGGLFAALPSPDYRPKAETGSVATASHVLPSRWEPETEVTGPDSPHRSGDGIWTGDSTWVDDGPAGSGDMGIDTLSGVDGLAPLPAISAARHPFVYLGLVILTLSVVIALVGARRAHVLHQREMMRGGRPREI